jgi:hypothetical protein
MTRYSIKLDDRWIAATYDSGPGILLTDQREDACSWVTHEAAVVAAKQVSEFFKRPAWIHVAEEPNYPASWKIADAIL